LDFPGYSIVSEIGRGGMATVYRARQVMLDREVALKVLNRALSAEPSNAQRFLQEARMLASLEHPNVVSVYDVGVTPDGSYYFSMQLLEGGDFSARLQRGVSEAEVVRVLTAVADALAYAHARGYVHRDVTPSNILFDTEDKPRLTDFGIALAMAMSSRITASGLSVGTSHYMSPEQARGGEVDPRSDIYSLGVVTYEALTGHTPFRGADSFAVAYAHVYEPVPPLPAALSKWQPLVDRSLAKNPEDRFQDCAAFTAALRRIAFAGRNLDAAPAARADADAPTRIILRPRPSAPINADAAPAETVAEPAEVQVSRDTPTLRRKRPKPTSDTAAADAPTVPYLRRPAALAGADASAKGEAAARNEAAPKNDPVAEAPNASRQRRWLGPALALAGVVIALATVAVWRLSHRAAAPIVDSTPIAHEVSPTPTPEASEVATDTPVPATGTDVDGNVTVLDDPMATATPTTDGLDTAAQQTVIDPVKALLALARNDIAERRYSSPPGRNALDRYRLVQRFEPNNADARNGIEQVAGIYLRLADEAAGDDDPSLWLGYLQRADELAQQFKVTAVGEGAASRRAARLKQLLDAAEVAATAWNRDEAVRLYERALALDPSQRDAQEGLAQAKRIGRDGFRFHDHAGKGLGPEMIVSGKLAYSRAPITVGDFNVYWKAEGRSRFGAALPSCRDRESFFRSSRKRTFQDPGFTQSANHPVVCINVAMAEGYVRWLSQVSGKVYRLPTGAELRTADVGSGKGCAAGNIRDQAYGTSFGGIGERASCNDGHAATSPVNAFKPGASGLLDVVGNVREWSADCAGNGCAERVAIGASWASSIGEDAGRSFPADTGFNTIGFRIVRSIP
jgi:serine/threonine-protein kinase PpkA